MPAPTLTRTGQEMYDALAPLANSSTPGYSDASNGYAMAILSGAFATMLDPISDMVREQADGTPGYGILMNPDGLVAANMSQWLPWLSQFVGDSQAVQAASTPAAQAALIKNPQNWYRGRPATIISAAGATLTGAQTVILNAYLSGNPNAVGITTFTSQTPNPQATINAVMAVLPAWIVPTFSVVAGGNYATLAASHSSYSLMEAAHTHYSDIPTNPAA